LPELLFRVFRPPPEIGKRCSTSAVDERPVRSIAARSRKVIGAGRLSGSRRMRLPVTTISPVSPAPGTVVASRRAKLLGVVGLVSVGAIAWARAADVARIDSAATAPPIRKERLNIPHPSMNRCSVLLSKR